jgi:mannose/fructose/N-acetylgalactosamine-specific phosphotransferase system component IID
MIFDRAKVPNFSIGKQYFEYIERELPADVVSGFFELLLEKDVVQLYKKHTKKIFKRTDNQTLYYEFKNGHYYLLRYKGEVYRFKKANDLGRIFPKKKKEIKQAAKRHSDFKIKSADGYVIAILNDLSLAVLMEKKEAQ